MHTGRGMHVEIGKQAERVIHAREDMLIERGIFRGVCGEGYVERGIQRAVCGERYAGKARGVINTVSH